MRGKKLERGENGNRKLQIASGVCLFPNPGAQKSMQCVGMHLYCRAYGEPNFFHPRKVCHASEARSASKQLGEQEVKSLQWPIEASLTVCSHEFLMEEVLLSKNSSLVLIWFETALERYALDHVLYSQYA